jgi:hypothetical protein
MVNIPDAKLITKQFVFLKLVAVNKKQAVCNHTRLLFEKPSLRKDRRLSLATFPDAVYRSSSSLTAADDASSQA